MLSPFCLNYLTESDVFFVEKIQTFYWTYCHLVTHLYELNYDYVSMLFTLEKLHLDPRIGKSHRWDHLWNPDCSFCQYVHFLPTCLGIECNWIYKGEHLKRVSLDEYQSEKNSKVQIWQSKSIRAGTINYIYVKNQSMFQRSIIEKEHYV